MKFAVETRLGPEELEAYHRITGKTVKRTKLAVIQGALLLVGAAAVLAGMSALIQVAFGVMPVVCVVAGAAMVALGLNYYRYLTWKSEKRIGAGLGEQNFFFQEDLLVAQTKAERVVHGYGNFRAVVEAQDYFALFLNKSQGYLLPKKGFFQGDPAEFSAFMEGMTGKKVIQVSIKTPKRR